MTDPLLNSTDYASFKAKDEAWFLGAAGETIRDYCGWHIYPVKSFTEIEAEIGNMGIIMLPTLNLVSVEAVKINGLELANTDFRFSTAGYLTYLGGVGRRVRGAKVIVDMTHGFLDLPKAVAEVGYELTGRTLEKPTGVVKHMTRGPTDIDFLEFGAVLSPDQKARLGPYTLLRV